MMIKGGEDWVPPLPSGERVAGAKRRSGEGPSTRAFVILGRSRREAACVDPRIHAVTLAEGSKRRRISAHTSTEEGTLFCTDAERRGNGMDPRVCAASLRSLPP